MREKINAIVISLVRHSDLHSVATLYTPSHGRVACLVPAPSARRRNLRLMPLQCITAELDFHPARELQKVSRIETAALWPSIYTDPARSATAFFISDFLNHLLREAQPDARIWDFIIRCLTILNSAPGPMPDFHIVFMAALTAFVGILPDTTDFSPSASFDLRAGTYTLSPPRHPDVLRPPLARWPAILARLTFANSRALRLSGTGRFEIISGLLRYYSIHFPGMGNIKSHLVLREVFA